MTRSWSVLLIITAAGCAGRPAALVADAGQAGHEPDPWCPCDGALPPAAGADASALGWQCHHTAEGRYLCRTDRGLPSTDQGWRCHQAGPGGQWVCDGEAGSSPGPGSAWSCDKHVAFGLLGPWGGYLSLWRCMKPDGPEDRPPQPGPWICWKGSKFGGTVCELGEVQPPQPSSHCYPGQKMWCDVLHYGTWGQVSCDPLTGTWKSKKADSGQDVLDCHELSDGQRPDTLCACYHFFVNPSCCERPDCVVPDGSSGTTCQRGPGGLCSYCNPQAPECNAAGARCLVTSTGETFCGQDCQSAACPAGFQCKSVKAAGGKTSQQCVPEDLSCYY